MPRYGLTIPLDESVPLHAQRDDIARLADLGYTDVWSTEVDGADAFTPLTLASVWAPTLRLGTAIIPAYTRGPATMAQCVASLADVAPGRVAVGIGSSSDVIVERWNGIPFDRPYQRVRDTVRFLKTALTGEKVVQEYETFAVNGFRLRHPPKEQPALLIAALREGMLRLAGREADGAIINWLGAEDVATVAPVVRAAAGGAEREIVARIFVAASTDTDAVRGAARMMITSYLNVPVYAAFHEWLGRGEILKPMWDAWKVGDRKAALEAVPDQVIDDLVVHGSPESCREQIARYVENGVTTPVLAVLPLGGADVRQSVGQLAPAAS